MDSAQDLHRIANSLRMDVLNMVYTSQEGHIAGALSSAEIFCELYFGNTVNLKIDEIILSCGHYCPIWYASLARSGRISISELGTFMQIGSRLPGHPRYGLTPGINVSTGSLGQGVSVAVGMALGIKLKSQAGHVFCVLSDGELQEGQVWEAFNFAVKQKLSNLTFILDKNGIQIEHFVNEIVATNELGRLEAFGLHTIEIDGNDLGSVERAIKMAKEEKESPSIIVANTIAGKGVSFMENTPHWHDKIPNKDELASAIKELNE